MIDALCYWKISHLITEHNVTNNQQGNDFKSNVAMLLFKCICTWFLYSIITHYHPFITGRNEVLAKVIFLHLSVILFTGEGVGLVPGGCLQFFGGSPIFGGGGPPIFWGVSNFPGVSIFQGVSNFSGVSPIFRGSPIFQGGLHRNMVNIQPVRILLECILVLLSKCTYFLYPITIARYYRNF